LALYTRLLDMGKRNKVVKLTKKKIDYIIRAKTRNDSNKNIAVDMKISKSTVKRVWTHWLIHKGPIPIKKFGRKKQGTQFYANKKDKNEESQSRFEAFLLEKEIQHIKARVKHPQTNGKVEKWFDLYEKYRLEFETFADFMKWYNTKRYHESLDQKHFLQTPENAFWARLPEGSKLNIFLRRMEVELYGRIYKQNEPI